MEKVIGKIEFWLNKERVQETIKVFTDKDSAVEGWFKGELMVLFSGLQEESVLEDFKRECKVSALKGRKTDFLLTLSDGRSVVIEMKAANQGRNFKAREFVEGWNDGHSVVEDIKKLSPLGSDYDCYVVAFVYPPISEGQEDEWYAAVENLKELHSGWQPSEEVKTDTCLMAVWHRTRC